MNKKFRIWRKDFKRWLTPDDSSLHCRSNWMIDPFTGKVIDWVETPDNDEPNSHFHPEEEKNFHICDGKLIKESPFVVQQWTGLLGWDGKEIWEGDIVEYEYYAETRERAEIIFNDGSFMLAEENSCIFNLSKFTIQEYKIKKTSNIFDK